MRSATTLQVTTSCYYSVVLLTCPAPLSLCQVAYLLYRSVKFAFIKSTNESRKRHETLERKSVVFTGVLLKLGKHIILWQCIIFKTVLLINRRGPIYFRKRQEDNMRMARVANKSWLRAYLSFGLLFYLVDRFFALPVLIVWWCHLLNVQQSAVEHYSWLVLSFGIVCQNISPQHLAFDFWSFIKDWRLIFLDNHLYILFTDFIFSFSAVDLGVSFLLKLL